MIFPAIRFDILTILYFLEPMNKIKIILNLRIYLTIYIISCIYFLFGCNKKIDNYLIDIFYESFILFSDLINIKNLFGMVGKFIICINVVYNRVKLNRYYLNLQIYF